MRRSILTTFLLSTALGFYVLACENMDSKPSSEGGADSLDPLGNDVHSKNSGLTAVYFDNEDFSGATVERIDPVVDFDWGRGSPDPTIESDTFSVRWEGFVQADYSETYTFYTLSDDGVRLWVGGELIIENWTRHSPIENSGSIELEAGKSYPIKMEFFEHGGGAVAKLKWSSPSVTKQTVPESSLLPQDLCPDDPEKTEPGACGCGTLEGSCDSVNGLAATYFDNSDFTGSTIERIDPIVDFSWGRGTPDPAIGVDTFSVRWTGFVQAEHSETCTFYTLSDDGVRLWVGGELIIDDWTTHGPKENKGTIDLQAGKSVPIKLEFFENRGGAVAKLLWSSSSITKQIIPEDRLFPREPQEDLCLDDPEKSEPGVCGCGTPDVDSNGNGIIDCNEQCTKCTPGKCGAIDDGCGNILICDEGCEENNIALQRMTEQSSTGSVTDSSRAVDGNTERTISDLSYACTLQEKEPWWRVDFNGPHKVTGVKIWTLRGWEHPLNNFHVDCLDEHGNLIVSESFSGTAGETIDLNIQAEGVYSLKIQLYPSVDEKKYLPLVEVKVWGFSQAVCVPKACADVGSSCGPTIDGCGGIIDCGGCEEGYACEENQCEQVCPQKSCEDLDAECGYTYTNCQATQYCGDCSQGSTCYQNECVACIPKTCSEISPRPCGYVDDGCGNMIDCGECESATFLVPMSLGKDASWEEFAFLASVPASMYTNDGAPSVLAVQKEGQLDQFQLDYLRRYKPGKVYTVGKQGLYSGDIELEASSLGEVTCELAELWGTSDTAVMSDSADYHLSLSASGLAGRLRAPLFFFEGGTVSGDTLLCLSELGVKKVITVGAGVSVANVLKDEAIAVDSIEDEYEVISWLEGEGYGVDYFAVCNSYDRSHFFAPKSSLAAPVLAAARNGAVVPLAMESEFQTPCMLTLTDQKPKGAAQGESFKREYQWKIGTCVVNGKSYNVALSRHREGNATFGQGNIDFNGDGDFSGDGEFFLKGELRAFGDKTYLIDLNSRYHFADVKLTYPHADALKAKLQQFHDTLGHPPKYMVIVGLPDAIPPHLIINQTFDLTGTPTDYVYADVDDDPMIDIALGRMIGESASVMTLAAARSTTYEDLLDYSWKNNVLTTGNFDTPREERTKVFENRGFNVDNIRAYSNIKKTEYSYIAHHDHGFHNIAPRVISGKSSPIPISPAVVLSGGCQIANISYMMSASYDFSRFGAVGLAKMGVVGFYGASKNAGGGVQALRGDVIFNSLIYENATLGEAFRDSLNAAMLLAEPGSEYIWRPAFFGDPALKPYVPAVAPAIKPARTVVAGDKVTAYAPEGYWFTYYWNGLCNPESKYGFDGPGLSEASAACGQPPSSGIQTWNTLGRKYIAKFTVDRAVADIVEQEGIEPGLGFNYTTPSHRYAPQYVIDEHWDGSSTVYMNLRFQFFNHQTGEIDQSYSKIEYYLQ